MHALRTAILLCICLVFTRTSFAQSSCDRRIVVNVRGSKGEIVSDLEQSSFQAKIGGHDATVTSESVFSGFNRVILVLDASGSISSGDKDHWVAIKNFAKQIIAFAPPTSRLALVMFNTQIIVKLGFDHARNELAAAIDQVSDAKALTDLWGSLLEASDLFGDASIGDSMVVISDFGDMGKHKPSEGQRALVIRGIRMFCIGVFDHYFHSKEESLGPGECASLAQQTGGDSIKDLREFHGEMRDLLSWLFDRISTFYVLKVTPSAPILKRERLNLSLVADDGKKNKGISLYYPQQVFPCTQ